MNSRERRLAGDWQMSELVIARSPKGRCGNPEILGFPLFLWIATAAIGVAGDRYGGFAMRLFYSAAWLRKIGSGLRQRRIGLRAARVSSSRRRGA